MNKPQSFIDRNRADTLLEKWAPVLEYSSDSVKAIEDDTTRLNTAILLENQEKWCIEESNSTGGGSLGAAAQGGSIFNPSSQSSSGDTYAPQDARLPKVLIPMIRRTFPELITNEIVGVQPMSGPVDLHLLYVMHTNPIILEPVLITTKVLPETVVLVHLQAQLKPMLDPLV